MRIKRAFDLVVGSVLLVLASPLFVLVAALIKSTSLGPVFHRAMRLGRGGAPFTVLKFRTMNVGATGPSITSADDVRVTRIGRLLRRLKVDELPQLINVLRGEMSLVGPRPEDPRYLGHYRDEERRILTLAPGITSPAALAFRHEEQMLSGSLEHVEVVYVRDILPTKLAMDVAYVEKRSFWGDIGILAKTALAPFGRRHPAGPAERSNAR